MSIVGGEFIHVVTRIRDLVILVGECNVLLSPVVFALVIFITRIPIFILAEIRGFGIRIYVCVCVCTKFAREWKIGNLIVLILVGSGTRGGKVVMDVQWLSKWRGEICRLNVLYAL